MKLLIVGYPRSGKTEYSDRFDEVVHLDDYMDLPFKDQIYKALEDINDKQEWVIEGIQGVRLFRKMLQLNESLPDKVIWIKAKYPSDDKHVGIRKMLDKVWGECMELNKEFEIEHEVR